jgi:hypothetical protein
VGLRVEVDELHTAAAQIARSVTTPDTLSGVTIAPAAADHVSATVAATLSTRLALIGAHSARAAHITSAAAAVLDANASTYRDQEESNAASLRRGGSAVAAITRPTASTPAAFSAPIPAPATSVPAGVTPTDGKTIAALLHGGTGPGPLLTAADQARRHAAMLRGSSIEIRSAGTRLGQSWQSPAAENAGARLTALADWYADHAEHAATAARTCTTQSESFARARAAIPPPQEFENLERRLMAANQANAAPNCLGRYTPVITQLQSQLAGLHNRALNAYADYTTGAGNLGADATTPPPPTVQALDSTFKQAPPGPFPEAPWEYNNDYTTNVHARGPDGRIVDGGSLVTLDDVWKELHRCFNCNFPIGGAPAEFPKVGDHIPLEMRIAGVQAANLPVEVTQIKRTADAIDIEFATLPGHEDGPGSTIHFHWTEQDGAPHLAIRGYITEGPGSESGPFAAPERVGYTALAKVVWQPYIDNVVTHVVQAKGYEALPLRVIGGH